VCADDRKFVSVMLSLNASAIRVHLARSGSIDAVSDFVETPAFHAEIDRHIQRVNQGLNEWERVRRWITAPSPFGIDSGELTPTLKVRRAVVLNRYVSRFDSLYAKK
jgi:long-chain acyl-CoA synthetase